MKNRIHSRIHRVAAAMAILGLALCAPGAEAADRSTAPGTFVGADLITDPDEDFLGHLGKGVGLLFPEVTVVLVVHLAVVRLSRTQVAP